MPTTSFNTTITIDEKSAESLIEILESEPAKVDLETNIKVTPYPKEDK